MTAMTNDSLHNKDGADDNSTLQRSPRVAIVGMGAAGLTLANVLWHLGHDNFVLYEKQSQLSAEDSPNENHDPAIMSGLPHNYSLTMQQADNVIRYLGLNLNNKCELSKMVTLHLNKQNKIGDCLSYNHHSKGNYTVPRGELLQALKARIPDSRIRYNKTVVDIQTVQVDVPPLQFPVLRLVFQDSDP